MLKKHQLTFVLAAILLNSFATMGQQKFTDQRDGRTYHTVILGEKTWFAQNLSSDKFLNGDPIPKSKNLQDWVSRGEKGTPAWAYFDFKDENEHMGKYYNWYAVSDKRGLAPKGWHVPGETEWLEMLGSVGGTYQAGKALKSAKGWKNGGNGDNSSGFNGEPTGFCTFSGSFDFTDSHAFWWMNVEDDASNASVMQLVFADNIAGRYPFFKSNGHTIRCVKD